MPDVERFDSLDIVGVELEVEHVDVLEHAVAVRALHRKDVAALDEEAERHLRSPLAVAVADRRECGVPVVLGGVDSPVAAGERLLDAPARAMRGYLVGAEAHLRHENAVVEFGEFHARSPFCLKHWLLGISRFI